jgi:hypothetical protein
MTIPEILKTTRYLRSIQEDNQQRAHLYFLSFNQPEIPNWEREHFQLLCEFYRTRNAVIERLFDVVVECADCGIEAVECLNCLHFFLYNQTVFNDINYNTYRQYSASCAG